MKSRTIIHVGLHKTGTSFLQENVFPNLNINYSPISTRTGLKHIVQYPIHPDEINLISSELLTNQNFTPCEEASPYIIANRLKLLFPDAKILLVTRNKEGWKKSLYNHYIRSSVGSLSREDWEEQVFKDIDYNKYISHLKSLFGDVLVLDYKELKDNHDSFVKCICDFIGVPVPTYNKNTVLKSSNTRVADGIRRINRCRFMPDIVKNILISSIRGSYWKSKYKE